MLERAIAAALATEYGGSVRLLEVRSTPLQGGAVARRVTRLDATFIAGAGPPRSRSFVLKHALQREISVMRLLRPLAEGHALPLLAEGEDADGPWLLLPFIAGRWLAGQLTLPQDVRETLAQLHTRFAARLDELAFLPRLDGASWADLLDLNERTLAAAPWPAEAAARHELRDGIERLRRAEQVPAALMALPQTLLHGDVHGGNMIASAEDGRTYLFDWGNARVGPAAVDLVNGVKAMDDPAWLDCWQRSAALTSAMPPADELRAGFHAGTAQINVQYLPYAIGHLGEGRALAMLRAALAAARELISPGL